MAKKKAHGGARKGAGRHPVKDKTDHPVYFRLNGDEMAAAEAVAGAEGKTVNGLAKALLLEAIGKESGS
jgi:hypothetical protein